MKKFITISTDKDELLLINVSHIVLIKKEDRGATIILSDSREIKSQTDIGEIKKDL